MSEPKSNLDSEYLRDLGSLYILQSHPEANYVALEYFNRSICFAENDSVNMALGYASRSAALLKLNMARQSLINIQLARARLDCPNRVLDKLNRRAQECMPLLAHKKMCDCCRNRREPKSTLDFASNAEIPFLADCLQLKHDTDGTPYVIASTDLKPNKAIAIDTAYTIVFPPELRYMHCEYCAVCLMEGVTPCESCTSAVYCSRECRTNAWKSYHKIECEHIDLICSKLYENIPRLAFRLLACGWSAFGSLENLLARVKQLPATTVFDLNYINKVGARAAFAVMHYLPVVDSNNYGPSNNIDQKVLKDWRCRLLTVLRAVSGQQTIDPNIEYLMGCYAAMAHNGIDVACEVCHDSSKWLAIFPFLTLLNGSKFANVSLTVRDGLAVITTNTTIYRGQRVVIKRYIVLTNEIY